MKIKSIKKIDQKFDRYDLTVKETSNFYANNILIHNTSQRVAKNIEKRPLKWWEKIINRFIKIDTTKIVFLNGTRRVILNSKGDNSGYYSDNFRDSVANKLYPYLEDYMQIYFEVVGYEDKDKLIMPSHNSTKLSDKKIRKQYGDDIKYTYGIENGKFDIYVYRISHVLPNGKEIDMPWEDVKNFCSSHNIKSVPELKVIEYTQEMGHRDLVDIIEEMSDGPDPICNTHPREGVCIRIDGTRFQCYKNKGFTFKLLEGILKENDSFVDPEEEV